MIITRIIQQSNNKKLLTVAFRYMKQKAPLSCFLADWNHKPNILRIVYRCERIELKFASFLEACRFIFSMRFIADAEALEIKQKINLFRIRTVIYKQGLAR